MNTTTEPGRPALVPVNGDRGAAGRDDPDPAKPMMLRAADAFDRRDHVMTAAAYLLHARATADSAVLDHPGFVPGEYVASLTGQDLGSPGTDPAVLAAELCTAGMWRRTGGGYRVLDWPTVYACLGHVLELRAVDMREAAARLGGCPSDAGLPSQARVPGLHDGLGPVGDLQLGQDVGDVIAHRLLAQPQPGRDRRVGPALGDQIQHLAFPVRQLREHLRRG
jgi:hypothetical protein